VHADDGLGAASYFKEFGGAGGAAVWAGSDEVQASDAL